MNIDRNLSFEMPDLYLPLALKDGNSRAKKRKQRETADPFLRPLTQCVNDLARKVIDAKEYERPILIKALDKAIGVLITHTWK